MTYLVLWVPVALYAATALVCLALLAPQRSPRG